MELKHFITFLYTDPLKESTPAEVKSNEVKDIVLPCGAYGFIVFDSPTDELIIDGKIISTDKINEKLYHVGVPHSIDEVKKIYKNTPEVYLPYLKDKSVYGFTITIANTLVPLKLNTTYNFIAPEEYEFYAKRSVEKYYKKKGKETVERIME